MPQPLAILAMVTVAIGGLASVAQPEPDAARIERYGRVATSTGVEVSEFVVTRGRPIFSNDRWPVATLVGLQLANAMQWIHRPDDTWVTVEYRKPVTAVDVVALRERGLGAIELRRDVAQENLPSPLNDLPSTLLANIASFLHFSSGALRIDLRDQSEAAAHRLATAINHAQDRRNAR